MTSLQMPKVQQSILSSKDKIISELKKILNSKKFKIFDMRNIYSSIKMKEQKIKYFSIGR